MKRPTSGLDLMAKRGMNRDADSWHESDFSKARLPMIVSCAGCEMNMPLPSTIILGGLFWCDDCGGDE